MPPAPGLDRFRIDGTLGQGASGVVYLAWQPELERRVALKELSPSLVADPAFLERFREEARIMARLDHPNCVRVYDLIEEAGRAVLVSEYVDGASLRKVVATAGRLTPEQALGVVKGALTGLGAAHALGLVHRDVKPENVIADREGVSKLADFGQAVFAAGAGPGAAGGISAGSPAYMSPEAVMGAGVDHRTDIYSAGAMLFELLTGRPPFLADNPLATMRMHVTDPAPDPRAYDPNLPEEVSAMLSRSLAKDPGGRQQNATDFLAELEAAAVAGYGEDWEKRSSIKPLVSAALAVLAAGIAAAGGALASSADVAAASLGSGGLSAGLKLALGGVLGAAVVGGIIGGFILLGGHGKPPATSPPNFATGALPSTSPSPDETPSPSPEPSPDQSPSPSPEASPSVLPTVPPTLQPSTQPTVHPTIHPTVPPTISPSSAPSWTLTMNRVLIKWEACNSSTLGGQTTPACSNPQFVPSGNGANSPCFLNGACGTSGNYGAWAELMETFVWQFSGAYPASATIDVSWIGFDGGGSPIKCSGGNSYSYTVKPASGTHAAAIVPDCEVQTGPGTYWGQFSLGWTDGAGNHSFSSDRFYWAYG